MHYSTVPAHIVDISAHEVSQPVRHPESPRQVSSHHLIHAATQQPASLQIPQDNPAVKNYTTLCCLMRRQGLGQISVFDFIWSPNRPFEEKKGQPFIT